MCFAVEMRGENELAKSCQLLLQVQWHFFMFSLHIVSQCVWIKLAKHTQKATHLLDPAAGAPVLSYGIHLPSSPLTSDSVYFFLI